MPDGTTGRETWFFERDMESPELRTDSGSAAVVFSSRSPDKPPPNEDSAALLSLGNDRHVLAVADGLGGESFGERASRRAVEAICSAAVSAIENDLPLRAGILDGFEAANQSVQQIGGGSATTLAVVEIGDGIVRPYHVGDSAILIVGGRGKLKLQTVAHSPVGYAVEAGLLDEEDAMHHAERHVVSNVVGRPEMRIEVGAPIRLSPRDTVLLASDGLFDNLHVPEIVELIRKGSPEKCAARLAEAARSRMREQKPGVPSKPDDLTFVLFRGSADKKAKRKRPRRTRPGRAVEAGRPEPDPVAAESS